MVILKAPQAYSDWMSIKYWLNDKKLFPINLGFWDKWKFIMILDHMILKLHFNSHIKFKKSTCCTPII